MRESTDISLWETALLADMRAEADVSGGKGLRSIFFGGGTPSLMPPSLVATLLHEAEDLWGFAADIEITLEANPSSVEASNFAGLAYAGVNRASLGVQSLEDKTLRWLGRLHSAGEALSALDVAQANFERVSFDMIYALPEQTPDQWSSQLKQALSLGTSHLSLYQLTIEPSTRFETDVRKGLFEPLDDDKAAELFEITQAMTATAGLPAYEVSNHAKPGEESRHNLTYWRYEDYSGIGPGAHGRRGGFATARHKKPENYLEALSQRGHAIAEQRHLQAREQISEAILMGLRLVEGIDIAALSARFGVSEEAIIDQDRCAHLVSLGLVWGNGARIGATTNGLPLLDALLLELVPQDIVIG